MTDLLKTEPDFSDVTKVQEYLYELLNLTF